MNFSKKTKFPGGLAVVVICLLLMVTGCARLAEETATLALKFTPEDLTTYRLTTEEQQTLKFEGSLSGDSEFEGGSNRNRIEMTFTQQIQSINNRGNAVTKITIKELKCSSVHKDNLVLDLDSSRAKDPNNPLSRIIGQSYTIEITPAGQVRRVIDTRGVRAASRVRFPSSKAAVRTAVKLLSLDSIKQRHTILALPAADKKQLRPGDSWSRLKVFSFPVVGPKSYERIYTLKEIEDTDGRQIAAVEMNAIPTSKIAEKLHKEQVAAALAKMFDNPIDSYTGQLKLNLTTGKVEKYLEKLQSEWVVVDPSVRQQGDKEPDAIRMGAIRLHRLEKID